jgi:hypothetical protein
MSRSTPKNTPTNSVQSLIADIVGTKSVLPGESQDQYAQALERIVVELEAKTPLQIYLAEKILDCLWWIRRYEDQKRLHLAQAMAETLKNQRMFNGGVGEQVDYLDLLLHHAELPEFQALLKKMGFTLETLRERALVRARGQIHELDRLIAMQSKTLEGFQKSYEHVSHRKLHAERLELSLEMLRRDVKAIEGKASSVETRSDGVDKTDSR